MKPDPIVDTMHRPESIPADRFPTTELSERQRVDCEAEPRVIAPEKDAKLKPDPNTVTLEDPVAGVLELTRELGFVKSKVWARVNVPLVQRVEQII